MRPQEELLELAAELRKTAAEIEDERISKPIARLEEAAQQVDRAFSGSWLGYHSRVYYDDLTPPPPGANFSQEWGLKDGYLQPLVRSNHTRLIATLNYDLALEKAAEQVGEEIDYGLDRWEKQKRVEWNRKVAVRLLKLHGSINWVGDPENITIRTDEVKPYERRVLIFGGTENKLSSSGPFLQFLYRFERSLFSNGSLLVVGYSFRDPHINAVLQRWYLAGQNADITVVDPEPPNLLQLGFAPSGGELSLGAGRSKKLPPVRIITKRASEGIMEYFQEPTLRLEAAG